MRIPAYLLRVGRPAVLPLICLGLRAAEAGSATWSSNPTSNDWNTVANWMPNTVPNAKSDIATLGVSNTTSVSTTAEIDLGSLVFTAGAPSYTVSLGTEGSESLAFWGEGVRNDSGIQQTVVLGNFGQFESSSITFWQGSTAGENVNYIGDGAVISFINRSSAGDATFYVGSSEFSDEGKLQFFGNSTASNATITVGPFSFCQFNDGGRPDHANITVLGGDEENSSGGNVSIFGARAEHATLVAEPAKVASGTGGLIYLPGPGLTGGTFIANGSGLSGAGGGVILLLYNDAGDGTYIVNGATTRDGSGAEMTIKGINLSAGTAFITVNGGEDGGPGGELTFTFKPVGSPARIALFGNGLLNLNLTDEISEITIGSLEGDGLVKLNSKELTIGSNNLSTTFSGTIQNTGSISKIGTGTLTLTGANRHDAGTTVTSGILLVSNVTGSGTGTGVVSVNAGTLGGSGIITGAVTVGTGSGAGASLAPAFGSKTHVALTLQSSLTLQVDATYTYTFKARGNETRSDLVIANGVTINGAKINLKGKTQGTVTPGTVLTVISNTSANPISGTFGNLTDGAIVNVNGNHLQASYSGGDGNDLTLTVVP